MKGMFLWYKANGPWCDRAAMKAQSGQSQGCYSSLCPGHSWSPQCPRAGLHGQGSMGTMGRAPRAGLPGQGTPGRAPGWAGAHIRDCSPAAAPAGSGATLDMLKQLWGWLCPLTPAPPTHTEPAALLCKHMKPLGQCIKHQPCTVNAIMRTPGTLLFHKKRNLWTIVLYATKCSKCIPQ